MKARWALAALASGALVLGLVAPGAASAAPAGAVATSPTAQKPSGKALVRIDGGTAYAKKKAKNEYRIVVPDGADIEWLGEVAGKGVRTGNFTPEALVAGWAKLGHSDKAKAITTLTWVEAGAKRPTFRAAQLWKPRVNSSGQLTFMAKANRLPQQMVDFAINVNRASKGARMTYPYDGSPFYIDGVHWLAVVLLNVAVGHIEYNADDASRDTGCAPDTELPGPGVVNLVKAIVCTDMTIEPTMIDGTPSYVQVVEDASGATQTNVGASYSFGGNIRYDFQAILSKG